MLQTFAASHPLATELLKQRRSSVVVDTTLFQIYKYFNTELTFSKTELDCCSTSMEIWGRSVKVTTLFMGRLRAPMRLHIRALDLRNLGPKFGPIPKAKKYVFFPILDEKFPI